MDSKIITLLTDFTMQDPHVGVMKGTILKISPDAHIVDLTHEVPAFDVSSAAFLLERSYRYFPKGTIHVAVVDPGVGSPRGGLAGRVNDHFFVAPNNGLLTDVLHENRSSATQQDFVELCRPEYWLPNVSNTFHGRDVFAPAAAHLARGVDLSQLGRPLTRAVRLPARLPIREEKTLVGQVIHVDRFGNLITNIRPSDLGENRKDLRILYANDQVLPYHKTYSDVPVGHPVAVIGGYDRLEIAVNHGDACARFSGRIGEEVRILLC